MTKPIPGIKIPYFLAEQYPDDVPGFRCVEIHIPDDPAFMALLGGLMKLPARAFNWQGATLEKRRLLASMWRDAYDYNCWEGCMDCEGVAECIDENEGTRAALGRFIDVFAGDFRNGAGGFGREMPATERATNLAAGSNPTCNDDILFAQCRFVIDETHLAVLDVLQKVEVLSNVAEIIKNVWDSVPLVAMLDDASGANGVVNIILYWQEAIAEQYEAQFTETVGGLRDLLAYALFCRCRPDCEITIDRILWVYENQLKQYIAPPSLAGVVNFVETLAGLAQDTTFVVELAHYVAWGLVKMVRFFFGKKYDLVLSLLIKIKADEPSNDWQALELLFGPCTFIVYVRADAPVQVDPPPPLNGNDTSFDVVNGLTYALNPDGLWAGGTGVEYDARGQIGALNPAAFVPTANIYRLIYKIGIGGTWLATDDTFEFTAGQSGRLYLAMNDVPTAYPDNSGVLTCDIQEVP